MHALRISNCRLHARSSSTQVAGSKFNVLSCKFQGRSRTCNLQVRRLSLHLLLGCVQSQIASSSWNSNLQLASSMPNMQLKVASPICKSQARSSQLQFAGARSSCSCRLEASSALTNMQNACVDNFNCRLHARSSNMQVPSSTLQVESQVTSTTIELALPAWQLEVADRKLELVLEFATCKLDAKHR